mgnify:CR=1 FL=1
MKQVSLFAYMLLALSACTSEEYVGENSIPTGKETGTIAFTTSSKTLTRAGGSGAAASLNNNFVVFGYKTVSNATSTVFNNYQVNWVQNTAGTTESNSADWEYVGYKNLPVGVSTDVGVTAFSALTGEGQANASAVDQSIKYWDFSATAYDFFAYSLGIGATDGSTTWAKASALSNSTYTLEGTKAQLGTCYISNKNHLVPSVSATEVELEFRSFLSQIELKFYETIPGYSVKSLSFYPSSAGSSSATPYLYTNSETLPTGGKYTITFDSNGKAQLSFSTSEGSPTYASNIAFSETLTNYKGAEYKEASDSYLGRASNDATSTNQISVLPNPQNTNNLNLKIDFILVSRDGTGEEINCTGATAVVPAAYAQWKPNYKYTYIFKISDNTNVQIGNVTGLYPITLDAVVTESDGVQETITTVSAPSITTYAKGQVVTNNDEYTAGNPIYIVVNDGTNNLTLTSKANLYTVTLAASTDGGDTPLATPAQSITEESVANALAKGTVTNETTWTVKDAHKWKMVVTKITDGNLTITDAIASTDSPTGEAITIGDNKVGKFTPAAGTNYVFQYEVEPAVAGVTYDGTSAAAYNATLPGAISATDVAYTFSSYGENSGSADTNIQHGTGMVKVVSTEGEWTTVEVVSNTPVDANATNFVGQQFMVHATTLESGQYYQLYTAQDSSLPIFVSVVASTQSEINTYNATLPGAVSAGYTSTAVPAKYQYKVIKVASGS